MIMMNLTWHCHLVGAGEVLASCSEVKRHDGDNIESVAIKSLSTLDVRKKFFSVSDH